MTTITSPSSSGREACSRGGDLGATVPAWLQARNEICTYMDRNESVNLVVRGSEVAWRGLVDHLVAERLQDLAVVDLQKPSTASRRGLILEILRGLGASVPVPPEPEDLVVLDEVLSSSRRCRLALTHFDLAAGRSVYGLDLFAALRYFMMELGKLVLLVQSRASFSALLPHDHPLSTIHIHTVELSATPT